MSDSGPAEAPLQFRPMTSADLPEVYAIETRVHFHPWRMVHFTDCLQAGHLAVVMELQGDLVGYALVSVGGREADLLNVAVAPEYQRRGFGSDLLNHLKTELAARVDTLFLEVRASNAAAIALYEQHGFNQVGLRPNYYPARKGREDALILAYAFEPPD